MKKGNSHKNETRDMYPVMRFDYNKRLIDSNLTALPLLGEWKCRKGAKIPSDVLAHYPELARAFSDAQPADCKVNFSGLNIWFDLVPFPEAGYVGLYGFHVETQIPEKSRSKIGMAE